MWVFALMALMGVLALLSVPVDLSFQVHRNGALRAALTVGWMFGLVTLPVTRKRREPDRKPKPAKKPAKKKRAGSVNWMRVILDAGFRRRLGQFLQQMFAAIRLRDFRLRLRVGFDDPADTGLFWAVVGPATVLLPVKASEALDLAPEFGGGMIEVDSRGRVRIIPAQLAWIAVAFALSPATVGAIWRHRRKR